LGGFAGRKFVLHGPEMEKNMNWKERKWVKVVMGASVRRNMYGMDFSGIK